MINHTKLCIFESPCLSLASIRLILSFFDYPVYNIPEHDLLGIDIRSELNIIIHDHEYDEAEEILLDKILASVGQSKEKSSLHLIGTEQIKLNMSQSNSLILCFGVDPKQLGLNIDPSPYILKTVNKQTFLFSHTLKELPNHTGYRKALWSALKKFYNVD